MVIVQQIGLSPEFLRDRGSVPLDDKFERTLSGGAALVVRHFLIGRVGARPAENRRVSTIVFWCRCWARSRSLGF